MKSWQVVVKVSNDDEPGKGFTLSLDRTPVTIGALPENDVVLAHPWVSGAHAHVVVSHGTLAVYDHSRNGTFVDGRRIQSAPVGPGDTVSVPPFSLAFVLVSGEDERLTRVHALAAAGASAIPLSPASHVPPPSDLPDGDPATPRVSPAATPALPPPPGREAPQASGVSLEVCDGPPDMPRRRVPLPLRNFLIGRDAEADLVFDLPTVSRLHAEIQPRVDGWFVRDLGSSNGTSVNGWKVTEAPLRPGDEVQLPGGIVIAFVLGDAPTSALRPPPPLPPAVPAPLRACSPRETAGPGPSTTGPGSGSASRALRVSQRRTGPSDEVLLLELAGRVDGYNYTDLGQILDAVVDRGEQLVAIDLSEVNFIDHTGLGVLVKSAAAIEEVGGQLRLCGLSQRLSDSFSLSRLDVFFRGKIARDARNAVLDLARG